MEIARSPESRVSMNASVITVSATRSPTARRRTMRRSMNAPVRRHETVSPNRKPMQGADHCAAPPLRVVNRPAAATIALHTRPGPMTDSNDRYVKTGVFLAPFHPVHENPLLALERDMDLLVHLDKLNYHEAWIGEHHSAGFEIINCPEMFIAGAAERTRHIRLGTGVVSLP